MISEQRDYYEFKAMQHLIPLAPDGFPVPHDLSGAELGALGIKMLKVDTILARRGSLSAEEIKLRTLCDATCRWLAAFDAGNRDPAIAEARFKALAEAES
ncbi:hypothetical protein [Mycobacterium asiaticum]|uniref:Uncharacterized protein n=1 Tax=Mycobacterium asiaticum TaxID=1790 RepID=A0A1A3MWQ4_MYCAS|nr:hypothetical protein [Mycobacterium asiaticum]OBK12592.1 hypothetical protein A5636_11285 [Mycobacterium asiaticum]